MVHLVFAEEDFMKRLLAAVILAGAYSICPAVILAPEVRPEPQRVTLFIVRDGGGFFVVPGSRVDIIHIVDGTSRVLLEDVLVLAVDFGAKPAEEIILQVPDRHAQKLIENAKKRDGAFALAIRPPTGAQDKPLPMRTGVTRRR